MASTRRTRSQIEADRRVAELKEDALKEISSRMDSFSAGLDILRETVWRLDLRMIVSELGADPSPAVAPVSLGPAVLRTSARGCVVRIEQIGAGGELVLVDDGTPGTFAMELSRSGEVIVSGRVPRRVHLDRVRDVVAAVTPE